MAFKPFAQPRPADEIPALHFTRLRDFRTSSAPVLAESTQQQEAQQQHTTEKAGPSSSKSQQPPALDTTNAPTDQQMSSAKAAPSNQNDRQPVDQSAAASLSNVRPSVGKHSFFDKFKQCFKPSRTFSEAEARPVPNSQVKENASNDATQPSPPAATANKQSRESEREEVAAAKTTVSDKAAKAGVAVKKWWMNSHTPVEQRPATWPEY